MALQEMDCTYIVLPVTFSVPHSSLQRPLNHLFTHKRVAAAVEGTASPIGNILVFRVLRKDTTTNWVEVGFEPPTFLVIGQPAQPPEPQSPTVLFIAPGFVLFSTYFSALLCLSI